SSDLKARTTAAKRRTLPCVSKARSRYQKIGLKRSGFPSCCRQRSSCTSAASTVQRTSSRAAAPFEEIMATVYTVASAPIKASRMSAAPPARIAVVHDWLLDYAGSERVLAEILRIFPQAHLFALVDHMGPGDRASLGGRTSVTTLLQRMPLVAKRLEYYLPLMPLAIEQIDLTGYDLVVSSSHAVAKGDIVPPDALHVSYVHSPMRYAWDMQFAYLQGARMERGLRGALLRGLLHRLRIWDHRSAAGVDHFVAN